MEISKVNVSNVQTAKSNVAKQNYDYLWDNSDRVDENVKYAAKQNQKMQLFQSKLWAKQII